MLFREFKGDFYLAFVHVFGFNYTAAAAHFGVNPRTVKRWLDQNTAPMPVLRYLDSMSRGFLPDYEPFASWYIDGTDILTPWGKVNAFDVEFLNTYKWNARRYAEVFKANKHLREADQRVSQKRSPSPNYSNSPAYSHFEVTYGY